MAADTRANPASLDHDSRIGPDQLASLMGLWSAGDGPLYAQLADAVGRLIDGGVLRGDELLPPERSLAAHLDVARGTVVAAYTRLAEAGLVSRLRGSGTRVVAERPPGGVDAAGLSEPLFDRTPRAVDLLMASPRPLPRVLATVDQVRLAASPEAHHDADPAGLTPLRERIAERLSADGLPTTASQVLVTAGAQHAILLCTMLLTGPGDVVLCEETTWPGLVDNVARFGGRTHPVAMDGDGIVVEELRMAVERLRPAFIALNPHHHNPTGTRLAPARRRQVAELAADYGVPLIEDRVVTSLAFDGQVPRPLAAEVDDGRDRANHLVIDSLSKTAWPGLRIGWIRADAALVARLRTRRALVDLSSPIHSQLAARAVLDDLDGVTGERITELRARADLLVDLLAEQLPSWSVTRPRGGLVTWVGLPEGAASSFCSVASRVGVLVASGLQFGADVDDHVRLPFVAPEAELEEGVRRLAEAWDRFDPDRPPVDPVPTLV